MLFRILSAAPLSLLLLSTDAFAAPVDTSLLSDVPVTLNMSVEAYDLVSGSIGIKHPTAILDVDQLGRATGPIRALAISRVGASSGDLRPVLDALPRQRETAVSSLGTTFDFPFQYRDYVRLLRLERNPVTRPPASASVVVFPLPASGWLLGSAILCGLLLGKGRRRGTRRHPLRYSTV